MVRRMAVLGLTAALIAGTVATAAPQTAVARSGPTTHGHGGAAEAHGVRIAAAHAARTGIDWVACPADWGLASPVQCGWVTVPVDYAKPHDRVTSYFVSGKLDRSDVTCAPHAAPVPPAS
ncbi:hypothetical protein [Actinacidiphila sp. bgisy160]|uniref:hypothetical protein n=1 Tax=Actinacidiphila sp. bgisy160 TaxID=3413796 RepID=UPI003D764457